MAKRTRRSLEDVISSTLKFAEKGPFTPKELADSLKFTSNRARQVLESLKDQNKLVELGRRPSARGKPATLWGLKGMKLDDADVAAKPSSSKKKPAAKKKKAASKKKKAAPKKRVAKKAAPKKKATKKAAPKRTAAKRVAKKRVAAPKARAAAPAAAPSQNLENLEALLAQIVNHGLEITGPAGLKFTVGLPEGASKPARKAKKKAGRKPGRKPGRKAKK